MYEILKGFRKKNSQENETGDIFQNIGKETLELQAEVAKNNIPGILEESADHVIYVSNILEAMGHDAKSNIESINTNDTSMLNKLSTQKAVSNILIALANYNLTKDIKSLSLIARIAMKNIDNLGYSSAMVCREKALVVASRTGSYNTTINKWVKDRNQDPDTLYKPDYDKCKL